MNFKNHLTPASKVITRTVMPVSVDEIKTHLRIFHNFDDSIIDGIIRAAVSYVDNYTNRLFGSVQLEETYLDVTLSSVIARAHSSLQVVSTTANGVQKTFGIDRFNVRLLELPPAQDSATVVIRYNTNQAVPQDVVFAIKLLCGAFYQMKSDISIGVQTYKTPFTVQNLLNPYRS